MGLKEAKLAHDLHKWATYSGMGCDLEHAQELIEEYRDAILDEKEMVWTKNKPTATGLYWWRTDISRSPGLCRVLRSLDSDILWVRIEGAAHPAELAKVADYFEWQPVKDPKP